MMSMNLSDIAILSINDLDYRCIINGISKNEALNLLQKTDINGKSGTLKNIKNLFSNKLLKKF